MKKIMFGVCIFLLSIHSLGYSNNFNDLEIHNFKFGILSKGSTDKLVVSKETTSFPYQVGLIYGYTYEFVKHKDSPIQEKAIIKLPSSPSIIRSVEDRNILSSNEEKAIIASDSPIKDKSGTWYFVVAIDEGDPIGKYVITIEHNGTIFKTIEYTIE